ncbi:rhamnogalacturonan acetylesterase [Roseateles sp. PN1]|uniref:rhamnogalacturonan acetylesterase n=1 Tax=Roseateles sp. PN1 TaxID=3137372 RepID=UPI003139D417
MIGKLALSAALLCGVALPGHAQTLGLRLILVGDSTMAPRSGYGNALCHSLDKLACLNLARGGRSSKSYHAEGLWANVLTLLREGGHRDLVLIQFGHNDMPGKPGRSTDLATEFGPNLAAYVQELRALGAHPVLLTPLTRRTFAQGELQNDLRPWAEATLRVASTLEVPVIDLNALSAAAVQALGQAEADTLAMAPPQFDRTHLGSKGAALFAEQVLQALLALHPELRPALTTSP